MYTFFMKWNVPRIGRIMRKESEIYKEYRFVIENKSDSS